MAERASPRQRKAQRQKQIVAIAWLSDYVCKGIKFCHGDNGVQLFYEAEVRGIKWMVLRPKPLHTWVTIAERKGCLKTLNCRVTHLDGSVDSDPLFETDCTGEIPVALLEALSDYIHTGADPFSKK